MPTTIIETREVCRDIPIKEGLLFPRQVGVLHAVNKVSLSVHEGETLALVGQSGAGKTTLGMMMLGGMANQLLQGTALSGESWLSRTSESFKADDRWHAYDPDKARALLEEAGAVGTKLVFATSTSGSGQMQPAKMAEWIQRNLNDAGFDAEIELMEWNAYLAKFFEGFDPSWSLVQMSWGWTGAYWLDMFLNPGNQPDGMMDVGVGDAITAAHQMTDPAAANEAYHAIPEQVEASGWFMPIVNDTAPIVLSPCVRDYPHVSDWQTGFVARTWLGC